MVTCNAEEGTVKLHLLTKPIPFERQYDNALTGCQQVYTSSTHLLLDMPSKKHSNIKENKKLL